MRILVATTIGRTADVFLREQLEHLFDHGHEVHLACAETAPVLDLADRLVLHSAPWSRSLPVARAPRALNATRRLLDLVHPDVLYTHTSVASGMTRLALRHGDRPVVVYCAHGFDGASAQPLIRRTLARTIERTLAHRTDLVFVMNDEDEQWAGTAAFGRVSRVPSIGIDLTRYAANNGPDTAAGETELVTIAELIPRKRVHLTLEAVALLDDRFMLTVLGDGPLRPVLEERAVSLGIGARVRFVGQVADVRPHLAAAHIFVTTSRQEGLQRSMLEAMASGVPTIGFEARGVTELAAEGTGELISGSEPADLARAIEQLARDDVRREQLRSRGLQTARRHDVRTVAPQMVGEIEAAV